MVASVTRKGRSRGPSRIACQMSSAMHTLAAATNDPQSSCRARRPSDTRPRCGLASGPLPPAEFISSATTSMLPMRGMRVCVGVWPTSEGWLGDLLGERRKTAGGRRRQLLSVAAAAALPELCRQQARLVSCAPRRGLASERGAAPTRFAAWPPRRAASALAAERGSVDLTGSSGDLVDAWGWRARRSCAPLPPTAPLRCRHARRQPTNH